jgi:ABC-type Fe3+ transport system permease subunit
MNALLAHWRKRTVVIVLVTMLVCCLMVWLQVTDWAQDVRVAALEPEQRKGELPSVGKIYLMSVVKALILMGVPTLLGIAVIGLWRRFRWQQ